VPPSYAIAKKYQVQDFLFFGNLAIAVCIELVVSKCDHIISAEVMFDCFEI
jgi:hypothetical protein